MIRNRDGPETCGRKSGCVGGRQVKAMLYRAGGAGCGQPAVPVGPPPVAVHPLRQGKLGQGPDQAARRG